MHKPRSYILASIVFSASILVIGYFSTRRTEHQLAGPPEKITIAFSATTDSALAQVALMQGYYLQEGLEVTPQRHPYGKVALQAVLEGKADFATVAETPVMFAIMNGESIFLVATIQTAVTANAIIARKDKGIRTPGDLKGRRIAVTPGTTSDFFMDAYLAVHGIARKDVKVVGLQPNEMPDALAKGDVDSASAFNPFLTQMQKELGDRIVTFYDEEIYTSTFNVVATQEFVRNNPGKVGKLLRALLKAEEFTGRNPAEAQKTVAELTRMDATLVREIWQDASFQVRLDQSLVLALEDESRWAVSSGLIGRKTVPDYLDFLYLDGLLSVKPEVVRILR